MQYTKNIYHSRPPLQHSPLKGNNSIAQKQQNLFLRSKKKQQDTEFRYANIEMQQRRRNSMSCKKNIYENQNTKNSRRPKQYCPLSKVKTSIDEQVLKKSREYIQSSQFNNYVGTVKISSINKEDLMQNMKIARTNNIYLPISQEQMHRPTLSHKCNQRRPIFIKNNNQNGDLFASFQLTIDHLSNIYEKEYEILQRNNLRVDQEKQNAYTAANINFKSNQHAILIKDEVQFEYMKKMTYSQNRERKPLQRNPIFPAYNKPTENIVKINEQNSMTKRKNTVYTPTKSFKKFDSSAKFVDYEEVDWLRKKQKTEIRANKYQYLAKQNVRSLVQNQRSSKKRNKKPMISKIIQSSSSSAAHQNSLPTAKASSIYDVDFKLQRPNGNSFSQAIFKKDQNCVFQETIKTSKKQCIQRNKQDRSYSRSHSRGKLSVITTSKYAHFH